MSEYINFEQRVEIFKELLRKNGLKAAVVSKFGSLCYFTNSTLKDRGACIIFANDHEPILIASNVEISRISYETWMKDIRECNFVLAAVNCPTFSEAIAKALKDGSAGDGEVGIESDDIAITEYEELSKNVPSVKFKNVGFILQEMMAVKETGEIERLKRCAEIVDCGMEAAFSAMKIGVSETEIAGAAEIAMRLAGSESSTYGIGGRVGTEVASGFRAAFLGCWSMPPTHKRLQRGDFITIDIHCYKNLYISDLSLNAYIGRPSVEQQKLVDTWEKAVANLLNHMKPGLPIAEAALSTRRIIEQGGFANEVSPLFGHGLGSASTRVQPMISETNKLAFKENMTGVAVITLTRPGLGGMRLELPTLITANGAEPLCKTPYQLRLIEV